MLSFVQSVATTPTPISAIHFVNATDVPVCAVNLWHDDQPLEQADADWLELTEVRRLLPGQRVSVGARLTDGPYRVRALSCEGVPVAQAQLPSLRPEQLIELVVPPSPASTPPL